MTHFAPLDWPKLERVTLVLCSACLSGHGGECHTPGCALWLNRAPDIDICDKLERREVIDDRA